MLIITIFWRHKVGTSCNGFPNHSFIILFSVGVDYLSAAAYDHLTSAHLVLLRNRVREKYVVNFSMSKFELCL